MSADNIFLDNINATISVDKCPVTHLYAYTRVTKQEHVTVMENENFAINRSSEATDHILLPLKFRDHNR